jgi:hypothetical protein
MPLVGRQAHYLCIRQLFEDTSNGHPLHGAIFKLARLIAGVPGCVNISCAKSASEVLKQTGLFVAKIRFSLLYEGAHPFGLVGGREH